MTVCDMMVGQGLPGLFMLTFLHDGAVVGTPKTRPCDASTFLDKVLPPSNRSMGKVLDAIGPSFK